MFNNYDGNSVLFKPNDGWRGRLELNFVLKEGCSVLKKQSRFGPILVQKIFYPEDDKINPHVYLLHPPGGLVGGDQIQLSVCLGSGSKILLTTPGATKFYRTNSGKYISQEHVFKLKSDAALEWLPQSSIFFPNTKVKVNTIFYLEPGARIITYEILCFGNDDWLSNNNELDIIDIFLHICLPHRVGLRDRLKINTQNYIDKLRGFKISASLFAIPANEMILKQVRNLITSTIHIQIGGVTLIDELLVVRLLGNDHQQLQEILRHIWSIIRPIIMGRKAVLPRIWFT